MRKDLKSLDTPLLALIAINLIPNLYLRPLWTSILCLAIVGLRALLGWYKLPIPPRWTIWVVQALCTFAIWKQYRSIFGDEASGTLLTILTCLKTYELKQKRDYFFNSMLCFLVLMSYLLIDQSLTLTFFLIADVVLIFSFLYALEKEYWDWGNTKASLRPTFGLALKSIPLLVICFILFPRFSTGFGTGANVTGKTGITDQLRPGSVAELISSDELVFRATFLNGEIPPKRSQYWRGAVLDVSNGLDWDRDKDSGPRKRVYGVESGEIEIVLEPGFEKFIFTLENTASISIPGDVTRSRISAREGQTYELNQPLLKRERYLIKEREANLAVPPEQDLKRYLQTTGKPSAEMQKLLRKLQGRTQNETVGNVLDLFRGNGYQYSMTPPKARDLDEFIFKNKIGFCEHYAGSMATMLRHMNVPSRVVVGFQGGTPSFLENYITVRGHDAHAWIEYYDDQASRWRRIDPTAVVAPARLTMGSDSYFEGVQDWLPGWAMGQRNAYLRFRALVDEVEANWVGFLVRFDLTKQKELLARFGMEETLFSALPVFLLLALALTMAVLYFLEAQRRESLTVEDRLYRDLLKTLRKRWKIERRPNEGPAALFNRIEAENPSLARAVEPLFQSLIMARFAGIKMTADMSHQAAAQLRQIRKLSIKSVPL